jgi:hypothetical protein
VTYSDGEPLDLAGIDATAAWQGAGEAPVTPEYVSGFDSGTQGDQTVIVEALGKQAPFTVTVKEPGNPDKWIPVQAKFAKNITTVSYGNGKFVVAGYEDGKHTSYVSDRIVKSIVAYSTDGITRRKAAAPGYFRNEAVFFGDGKFFAIGDCRYRQTGNTDIWETGCYVVGSSDGVNWPDRNNILSWGSGQGAYNGAAASESV